MSETGAGTGNLSIEGFLLEIRTTLETIYNVSEEQHNDLIPLNATSLKGREFTLVGKDAVSKSMATQRFSGTAQDEIICVFKILKAPTPSKLFYTRSIVLPVEAHSEKFQNKKIELTKV
jgi:hypothetical protein